MLEYHVAIGISLILHHERRDATTFELHGRCQEAADDNQPRERAQSD